MKTTVDRLVKALMSGWPCMAETVDQLGSELLQLSPNRSRTAPGSPLSLVPLTMIVSVQRQLFSRRARQALGKVHLIAVHEGKNGCHTARAIIKLQFCAEF